MKLKSEKMQNCVSKIREKNKLARNLFFDSSPSQIKIIDHFADKELNKENIAPNEQMLVEKEDINIEEATFKKKLDQKRVFQTLTC